MSEMSKTTLCSKLFLLVFTLGVLLYTIIAFNARSSIAIHRNYLLHNPENSLVKRLSERNQLKYILVWTTVNKTENFEDGIFPFINNRCSETNCFLTYDKNLPSIMYTQFDAVVFNSEYLLNWKKTQLPFKRSEKQKYIFYSTLSSDDAPVCNIIADDYFNWTCTYKLDSDIVNPMIEVVDLQGNNVAPNRAITWKTANHPLLDMEKKIIKNKTKAMAWIVNRCVTINDRMIFARKLRKAFKEMMLDFDIYGCGFLECPKGNCLEVLHNYYFYFAAEDSDSSDYVTTEVLKAYDTFTVPVVKGAADYRKFLPDGSYIDAGSISIDKLVARVDYAIRNPTIYTYFHLWRQHYRIRPVSRFHGLCDICKLLNDKVTFNRLSVKRNFRKWWHDRPLYERCLPKSAESLSSVWSYFNKST